MEQELFPLCRHPPPTPQMIHTSLVVIRTGFSCTVWERQSYLFTVLQSHFAKLGQWASFCLDKSRHTQIFMKRTAIYIFNLQVAFYMAALIVFYLQLSDNAFALFPHEQLRNSNVCIFQSSTPSIVLNLDSGKEKLINFQFTAKAGPTGNSSLFHKFNFLARKKRNCTKRINM